MYWQSILDGGLWLRWVALAIFIAAGITDILDGYFARMWGQQSSLRPHARSDRRQAPGRVLPADARGRRDHPRLVVLWAPIVILCRKSWFRDCANIWAELRVSVPVTRLAKWKTTWQLSRSAF